MHRTIINKIKTIRIEKGLSTANMAEKLNIDHSAYTRLESGKAMTWSKYLEDILLILAISQEDFFKDLVANTHIVNEKGSILGNNGNVENLYADNKEMHEKIQKLNEARILHKYLIINDKNLLIQELKDLIKFLKS